jgi:four helix bundle protein
MEFVERIYTISARFPAEERFGLTNQLRRAAVSIPANIAEGRGRETSADFARFLVIARGSLFEVETYIYLARNIGYISEDEVNELIADSSEIARLLNGLIRSVTTT